ncbi:nucleotidyltransferase domain-containing protein [Microtetraspora malaysiensis]|uniref:nucleotidyltransferase domain-containing protein n=1 Tax=Microtetraspora malaysiensis TaxID=161358 RepID=UPI00082E5144|nr:nucleotidyltransferase domain-containing protein [Microtetraspora malaysiensis]
MSSGTRPGPGEAATGVGDLVPRHLVLSVVVGSRAYGLATADSDVDRRGVFVPPTPMFWHLDKPPTHVEGPRPEEFSWEVERFCVLALGANPTVLECLWSPLVEHATETGARLRAIRKAFLSIRAEETFLRYADAQFRRISPERPKWKQVMHMIRLLISGRHLVREGEPLLDMSGQRDRLLAVRRGEVPWPEVVRWRADLVADLSGGGGPAALPAEPERAAVEAFLIDVRRSAL